MPAARRAPVHRFLLLRGELRDVAKLTQLDMRSVREAEAQGQVTCPTCRGQMRVVIGPEGPQAEHVGENPYATHEPEDFHVRRGKRLLAEHLQARFPSGTVSIDTFVPEVGQLADIAFVNSKGGKMVVEYQAHDILGREVKERSALYEGQGIRCLWMLDSSRLKLAAGGAGGVIKKATLERLETAILGLGEPLLYLDVRTRQVAWVRPHPGAVELARLGEPRIGQVPCLVRRYRLSGLRVREGAWWVDTSCDPRVSMSKSLPPAVANRLEARRASAAAKA
jgi:hypothetical protein